MTSQPSDMKLSSIFLRFSIFFFFFFFFVKFTYWSNFHVNIITGSGVMTIFFHKGLTSNLDVRNTPV